MDDLSAVFQVVLLGGYAYAHWLARWRKPRSQAFIHGVLLLAALAALPIIPANHWKPPPGGDPTWRILALLAGCIGLPYFVLSATGPLMQSWLGRDPSGPLALPALRDVKRRFLAGAAELSLLGNRICPESSG